MRDDVRQVVDGLRAALENAVGQRVSAWPDQDRAVVEAALESVGQFAVVSKLNPDLAELERPIVESTVARLKSLSSAEGAKTAHSFLSGALEVLKVVLPVVFAIVPK